MAHFPQHITSRGIGGSEITAIIGLDPYNTPFSVWERKTGRVPKTEGNKFTKAGLYLEDAIACMFADESGHPVYRIHPEGVPNSELEPIRHPDHPFLIGFLDRGVSLKTGDGILEIKNTLKRVTKQDIMEGACLSWFFQVQWYLGLTGRKKGFIAWLCQGVDFDWLQVDFDEAIFGEMVSQGVDFWNNHIIPDVAPPPIRREDIERMYKTVQMSAVEVDENTLQYHQMIQANNAAIKELERTNDELKEAVQLLMLDKALCQFRGMTLFTWSEQVRKGIDAKKLQAEFPEAYTACLTTTKSRVFRIK